jgi:hypothetical protein
MASARRAQPPPKSSGPQPSMRHEFIAARAGPLTRACAPSCVHVMAPPSGATARAAASHGAPAEPLYRPRVRHTRRRRASPLLTV